MASENSVPLRLRPSTLEPVHISPTVDHNVQLARGYGWKRARKKSTTRTPEKTAGLRPTETSIVVAQTSGEPLARGYGWKRARKKMMA
jgi:hypothetical protein